MTQGTPPEKPICVATTQSDDHNLDHDLSPSTADGQNHSALADNYFKCADWCVIYLARSHELTGRRSPDGTTLLTDSADHHIRTFILLVAL